MDELNPQFIFSNLVPQDPAKRDYGEELWSYSLEFNEMMYSSLKGETVKELGKTKNKNCLC